MVTVLINTSIRSYANYHKQMIRLGKTPMGSADYGALTESYKEIVDAINAQISALPKLGEKPL